MVHPFMFLYKVFPQDIEKGFNLDFLVLILKVLIISSFPHFADFQNCKSFLYNYVSRRFQHLSQQSFLHANKMFSKCFFNLTKTAKITHKKNPDIQKLQVGSTKEEPYN